MNIAACQQVVEGVGNGVAASLRAVDCAASTTAQQAFARLFGSEGALMPALTILLTIYVALFAFALITGRTRVGVASLTPRMVTLGLVLTFATSWLAYQSVVWNIVVGGPDQIAGILTGSQGSATQVFADKIDIVLAALIQATGGEQGAEATSTFSPKGLLWLGATLLLLGTVGVLATCKIALAVLLALGPVFVVMALFRGTRGLFAGWLKGLVMLALAPLFAVLSGSLMLELMVPILSSLAQIPGQIAPQAAMAFFMIGAVHCALMFLVLKVAGAMVSGWTVFGLTTPASVDHPRAAASAAPLALPSPAQVQAEAQRAATATAGSRAREIRAASALVPANDSGGNAAGGARRETRFISDGGNSIGTAPAAPSRTRGIGNRFRPARSTEKLK